MNICLVAVVYRVEKLLQICTIDEVVEFNVKSTKLRENARNNQRKVVALIFLLLQLS